MSLEKVNPGAKSSPSAWGEGRREQAGKQSAPVQNSGGVRVDSASGSKVRISWEGSGDGKSKSQGTAQAGSASEAGSVVGEVGVPHSTVDLHHFKRCREGRGDTYSRRRGEAKDTGMARATEIITPEKVRQLQITLYRKAKAQPKYRFLTDDCGVESDPMNEFGEPNMGNPSVRFDEGRERVGHWPLGLSAPPLLPTLRPRPAVTKIIVNITKPRKASTETVRLEEQAGSTVVAVMGRIVPEGKFARN